MKSLARFFTLFHFQNWRDSNRESSLQVSKHKVVKKFTPQGFTNWISLSNHPFYISFPSSSPSTFYFNHLFTFSSLTSHILSIQVTLFIRVQEWNVSHESSCGRSNLWFGSAWNVPCSSLTLFTLLIEKIKSREVWRWEKVK